MIETAKFLAQHDGWAAVLTAAAAVFTAVWLIGFDDDFPGSPA